jgi:aromatase
MAQPRIRTTRHTTRVAAPPRAIYELVADVDHWPRMFDTVLSVEHIGWSGGADRVRFWGSLGDRRGSWVAVHDLDPKRMQLRFRQERAAYPFASLGGLWLVAPKGTGALVALDHYFTVVDDDPAAARRIDDMIERRATGMLGELRGAAERGGDVLWFPVPAGVKDVISR